jgi:hypothetical protein
MNAYLESLEEIKMEKLYQFLKNRKDEDPEEEEE